MEGIDQGLEVCFNTWRVQGHEGFVFLGYKDYTQGDDSRLYHRSFQYPRSKGSMISWAKKMEKKGHDLYWCPRIYPEAKRHGGTALSCNALYQDLDNLVTPDHAQRILGKRPSVVWETSKGSYQAIWYLTELLSPEEFNLLNYRVHKTIGSDQGSWHDTKMIRIPGTRNGKNKYSSYSEEDRMGKLIVNRKYDKVLPRILKVKKVDLPQTSSSDVFIEPSDLGFKELLAKHKGIIPAKAKEYLLINEQVIGSADRSRIIFGLVKDLYRAKLSDSEVFHLINQSPWGEKYQGSKRRSLITTMKKCKALIELELQKQGDSKDKKSIKHHKKRKSAWEENEKKHEPQGEEGEYEEEKGGLLNTIKPLSYYETTEMERHKWLIDNWLVDGNHGMVIGESKAYKSTILSAMSLSVATGVPLFGKFPVTKQGKVLIVQMENDSAGTKYAFKSIEEGGDPQYIREIKEARERLHNEIPIDIYNFTNDMGEGFVLTNEDHRDQLEQYIKKNKPVLVILDPLYLLKGELDVSNPADMEPLLKWVKKIPYMASKDGKTRKTTVVIATHTRKKANIQGKTNRELTFEDIMGTQMFSMWWEFAILLYHCAESRDGRSYLAAKLQTRYMGISSPKKIIIDSTIPGKMQFLTTDLIDGAEEEEDKFVILQEMLQRDNSGYSEQSLANSLGVSRSLIKRMVIEGIQKKILIKRSDKKVYLIEGGDD